MVEWRSTTDGPAERDRPRRTSLLAVAAFALLSVPVVPQTERDQPVYRWTERFAADGDASGSLPVFSRASAPQALALRLGTRIALVDLAQGQVDWYEVGARATEVELQLPPRGQRQSSGNLWREERGAEFLSPSGERVRLAPRAPLRGVFGSASLASELPGYTARAEAYEPDRSWMEKLAASVGLLSEGASLTVVFGSWCVACEAYVPRLLKVTGSLDLPVEWVGVAPTQGAVRDPAVVRHAVERLPTLIVHREGAEIGRIDQIDALRRPERSLARLLSASGSAR